MQRKKKILNSLITTVLLLSGTSVLFGLTSAYALTPTETFIISENNGSQMFYEKDKAVFEETSSKVLVGMIEIDYCTYACYADGTAEMTKGNFPSSVIRVTNYVKYNNTNYVVTSFSKNSCYTTSVYYLSMPDTVTYIGDNAFKSSSLRDVILSENLTTIGKYAFHGTSLETVIIPEKVTYIGNNAFPEKCTLDVVKGSYAEQYAIDNGYNYTIYTPEKTPDPTSAFTYGDVYGDMNNDGIVSSVDVVILVKYLLFL